MRTDTPEPDTGGASENDSAQRAISTGGMVALATLLSRITGFAKAVVILVLLTPAVSSAFNIANQIPNMVADLVLGAVITQAFIPVLVRAAIEDEDGGKGFTRRAIGLSLVVLTCATAISYLCVPYFLPRLLDHEGGKVPSTLVANLLLLLLPQIFFYGLFSVGNAILNQRDKFKTGAWAPVINNCVVLCALSVFWVIPGSGDSRSLTPLQFSVLGLGATLGVVVQAGILLIALRREGVDLTPQWGIDSRLKKFGNTIGAMVTYVIISQLGLLVALQVSGRAEEGGPSIYVNVWLLVQLPYGVLGVTIISMMTPQLSRAAARGDTARVIGDLRAATRYTMTALVPIVAIMTIGGPLIGVSLFGYGKFDLDHAYMLGSVLRWSAFVIIPYAVVLVQLRVFYARQEVWTPTWIVLGITAVKTAGSYVAPLITHDALRIQQLLGIANGVGYAVGACIGFVLLRRELGPLGLRELWYNASVVGGISAAGAVLSAAILHAGYSEWARESLGRVSNFLELGVLGMVGLVLIYGGLWMVKVPEIRVLVGVVRRYSKR